MILYFIMPSLNWGAVYSGGGVGKREVGENYEEVRWSEDKL